jgi:hypothetical protein
MNIELRKVKYHEDMSDETNCFSAEVWTDGRLLARVSNQGCGGSNNYDFNLTTNGTRWEAFTAFCKAQPPHVYQGYTIPCDTDMVIDDLFSEWLKKDNERRAQEQIHRWCRTKTVFRLKGDKPDTWRTVKSIYTPAVKKYMTMKYGDRIEAIANEMGATA